MADALARTTRYGKCPRRERQAIAHASIRLEVPTGTVLAREGDPARRFAIVLTGAAEVLTGGRTSWALLAGEHFGDVALLGHRPSPSTVVAATPMSLAVVGADAFPPLLDASPSLARAVLDGLAARVGTGRSSRVVRASWAHTPARRGQLALGRHPVA